MGWRADWLYRLVLQQIERIWQRAQREAERDPDLFGPAPEAFCVRECQRMDWEDLYCLPPVARQWRYTGTAFEAQPPTETSTLQQAVPDHAFHRIGLVHFYVAPDRKRVGLVYVLGPLYGRGLLLKVRGQGASGKLVRPSGAGWVS